MSLVCVFLWNESVNMWIFAFFSCLSVCFCVSVSMCVTGRPAVWLKARPWEAVGWHQRTNCTHNNVRFHVNGRPLLPCLHSVGPSSPISALYHHRRPPRKLSISHRSPYSLPFFYIFLCPSASVSQHLPFFPSSLSIPPCLFLSFSSSFSLCVVGDGCFSWQVNRLDGGLVPVTLHIFPSFSLFLSSLPFLWQSILGRASSAVYRRCSPKALR